MTEQIGSTKEEEIKMSHNLNKEEDYRSNETKLNDAIDLLTTGFEECTTTPGCIINIMSVARLEYEKQKKRWSRGIRYEDEEAIEFYENPDFSLQTSWIVPDDEKLVEEIKILINKFMPEWTERILKIRF